MRFFREGGFNWYKLQDLPNRTFNCGYCDTKVSSVKGYKLGFGSDGSGPMIGAVYICPNCGGPVFFTRNGEQRPSSAFGRPVQNVPGDLNALYEEARRCTREGAYTASVLLCRKMLMNIAVTEGAKEGLRFVEYVDFLANRGYVPPNGRHWVDYIRRKGNEATHEIALMTKDDAEELITFTEMLLRFIYEFPNMIPQTP